MNDTCLSLAKFNNSWAIRFSLCLKKPLKFERKKWQGALKDIIYGMGSRIDLRHIQSRLEGIGSSRQVEAIDGVQIAAMSQQIAQLACEQSLRHTKLLKM